MNHRGRFQAQGKNLEESEAWAQNEPIYIDEAKSKLLHLKGKLIPHERRRRENAFHECEIFITKASESGGVIVVDKPLRKSFPGNNIERVDVEVLKGSAFLKKDENA